MLITILIVDSYPQFLRSPLGTPGTMTHHLARKHEKKKERKRNACILSLAAKANSTKKKLKEEKEKKDLILVYQKLVKQNKKLKKD